MIKVLNSLGKQQQTRATQTEKIEHFEDEHKTNWEGNLEDKHKLCVKNTKMTCWKENAETRRLNTCQNC